MSKRNDKNYIMLRFHIKLSFEKKNTCCACVVIYKYINIIDLIHFQKEIKKKVCNY